MKKYEILYDWPIIEINRIANSEIAENYSNQLEERKLNKFIALTEIIRTLGSELEESKAEKVHFLKWNELFARTEEFSREFTSFPFPSVDKLKLSIILAEKLKESSQLPLLDEEDIDAGLFELRELTQPIPHQWFCRENTSSLADSVIIFSCGEITSILDDIISDNISPALLFNFIAALHVIDDLQLEQAILVKRMAVQSEEQAINAFARLVVLATGKPIHVSHRYTKLPNVLNPDKIQLDEGYQQWSEILNVLSEYNSRDETLLKFLTIYHVIENFMFKRPIVELERQRNGQMFSIRDFRRLYDHVDMHEDAALKILFRKIFSMYSVPGVTFKDSLIRRWALLIQTTSSADIDAILDMIGLDFKSNAFSGDSALSCFYKLVYIVRNSIVHNKETEFHLNNAPLNAYPKLCNLIEDFLLPSLEEICFTLISKNNPEFWYQNKEIHLYI